MGKKRVLSLILILMIVVCCVTEAVMIGQLKAENTAMQADIEALVQADRAQVTSIDSLNGELVALKEESIPQLYLPKDIYVCAGLTMEVYNDCVAQGVNLEEYDFYWECEVGDCMEDKWRIHAADDQVGDYSLNLHIYNMRLEEVISQTATVHIVPNVFAKEETGTLKMVTIGDSLSAGTEWLSYTRFLSGDKLSHLGTLGEEESLMHEGRPGITAADYLSGTLYGEPIDSPFINPATGEFDWAYYKESNQIEPDVVQVFLGINGLDMDPSPNCDAIFDIVDNIRKADPDIPILLVEPIFPSYQDGMARQQNITGYEGLHGMWAKSRAQMIFNLIYEMDERADEYHNLTVVPASIIFDRTHGFRQDSISVNPHSDITEVMPAEGIHPSSQGYGQIGDAIYSTVCYLVDTDAVTTTHQEEVSE